MQTVTLARTLKVMRLINDNESNHLGFLTQHISHTSGNRYWLLPLHLELNLHDDSNINHSLFLVIKLTLPSPDKMVQQDMRLTDLY